MKFTPEHEALRQTWKTLIDREINPNVHVFVRSAYLRDVETLRRAGAEQVFAGEGEVALAMTEGVLRQLGATPEQIDRERDRVRAELFGGILAGRRD